MSKKAVLVLFGVIVVLGITFAFHSNALENRFTNYDDDLYIYQNHRIKKLDPENILWLFTHGYYRSYIPVTMISHAIDYAVWGLDPLGHHLTSVVIHSVNSVWVFLFGVMVLADIRRRAGPPGMENHEHGLVTTGVVLGSAVGALLFSLHPLRVESVGWVSDRKDLLVAFFTLPSLAAYMVYASGRGGKKWYLLSMAAFVFAVMSKSIAVVTPVIMVLIDILVIRRRTVRDYRGPVLLEKIPFFLISLAIGIASQAAAAGAVVSLFVEEASQMQRLLFPFYATFFYVGKMFFPSGLVPVYNLPEVGTMVFTVFLFAGLLASFFLAWKRGWLWWVMVWLAYLVFLSPTMIGLSAGIQPLADRYSYLPSVSFCLLAGGILAFIWDRAGSRQRGRSARITVVALSLAVLTTLGIAGVRQMQYWRSSESLWQRQIAVLPVVFGYNNLGHALMNAHQVDAAIEAFEQVTRQRPNFAEGFNNLGVAYNLQGRSEEAMQSFARAIKLVPDYIDAYVNLGTLLREEGRYDDALRIFEAALKEDPRSAGATFGQGALFEAMGDTGKAMAEYRRAIDLKPDYAAPYAALSNLHIVRGEFDKAIALYQEAIRMNPLNADAHYNLGYAYYGIGDAQHAIECFARALRIDPGYAQAYFNLGVIYGNQYNDEASVEAFRRAARLGFKDAQKVLSERGIRW
jgi:protein O-mannosyl-transferase